VILGQKVPRELPELRGLKELQVLRVPKAVLGKKDHRESQVLKELKGMLDRKELRVPEVLMAFKDTFCQIVSVINSTQDFMHQGPLEIIKYL
jgi:hypothetical protein